MNANDSRAADDVWWARRFLVGHHVMHSSTHLFSEGMSHVTGYTRFLFHSSRLIHTILAHSSTLHHRSIFCHHRTS
jgi:hypothetical protein